MSLTLPIPTTSAPKMPDRILVVDDSPETLGFLTDAMERAGMMVLVATEGTGALALVEQITPDLILLDAVMPGIDGFETCRRLKQSKDVAHVPVIFMTALSETEHVVQGLGAGGVDYITKPIVLDELLARIKVHLGNARNAYAARSALDITGCSLFAVDESGGYLWSTPQAAQLLSQLSPLGSPESIPAMLRSKLVELRSAVKDAPSILALPVGPGTIEFSFVGEVQPREFLFRLAEIAPRAREVILRDCYNLTPREADVLIWIAAGKSNRDIGDILSISARTVNKHLEQIFPKLGVENRASAASLAIQAMTSNANRLTRVRSI